MKLLAGLDLGCIVCVLVMEGLKIEVCLVQFAFDHGLNLPFFINFDLTGSSLVSYFHDRENILLVELCEVLRAFRLFCLGDAEQSCFELLEVFHLVFDHLLIKFLFINNLLF